MSEEVELKVIGADNNKSQQSTTNNSGPQQEEEEDDTVDHEIIPDDNTFLGDELITESENIDYKYATLELTHRNPLTILYDPTHGNKIKPEDELSTQQWTAIIEKLADMGVEEVLITGGEPLIREDFHTLLQYAINHFDNVVVKTNGLSKKNLSDYDCEVQIPVEYVEDLHLNNEVRRLTDPREYDYDLQNRRLINRDIAKCKFCGEKTKQNTDDKNQFGGQVHLSKTHQDEIFEDVNQRRKQRGKDPIQENQWQYIKNSVEFDYNKYLEPITYEIEEKEFALREALNRARNLIEKDMAVTLRAMIYNNNDLDHAVYAGELLGCDTVFVPLRPLGRDTRLLDQVPNPGRMEDVIQKIYQYNYDLENNHRIESPLYKLFKYEKDKKHGILDTEYEEKAHNWLKKGRASRAGRSKMNITPDGTITPSRFIRGEEYELGNILEKTATYIRQQTAKLNDSIMNSNSLKPVEGFDVRQRSLGEDPDIFINKSYSNPENSTEVN